MKEWKEVSEHKEERKEKSPPEKSKFQNGTQIRAIRFIIILYSVFIIQKTLRVSHIFVLRQTYTTS